jgi:hypothetical protein
MQCVVNLSCNFERRKSVTLTCKDEWPRARFLLLMMSMRTFFDFGWRCITFFCDCQIVCNRDWTFCCITCLRCHNVGLCIVVFEFEMSS